MPASRLTAFQQEVLREFFHREDRFFLTGGDALAGFHLGHRETLDLDLFTTTAAIDDASKVLADLAHTMGASLERLRSAPDFRRTLLTRGRESVVVDTVFERVPQLIQDKPVVAGIRVDPPGPPAGRGRTRRGQGPCEDFVLSRKGGVLRGHRSSDQAPLRAPGAEPASLHRRDQCPGHGR